MGNVPQPGGAGPGAGAPAAAKSAPVPGLAEAQRTAARPVLQFLLNPPGLRQDTRTLVAALLKNPQESESHHAVFVDTSDNFLRSDGVFLLLPREGWFVDTFTPTRGEKAGGGAQSPQQTIRAAFAWSYPTQTPLADSDLSEYILGRGRGALGALRPSPVHPMDTSVGKAENQFLDRTDLVATVWRDAPSNGPLRYHAHVRQGEFFRPVAFGAKAIDADDGIVNSPVRPLWMVTTSDVAPSPLSVPPPQAVPVPVYAQPPPPQAAYPGQPAAPVAAAGPVAAPDRKPNKWIQKIGDWTHDLKGYLRRKEAEAPTHVTQVYEQPPAPAPVNPYASPGAYVQPVPPPPAWSTGSTADQAPLGVWLQRAAPQLPPVQQFQQLPPVQQLQMAPAPPPPQPRVFTVVRPQPAPPPAPPPIPPRPTGPTGPPLLPPDMVDKAKRLAEEAAKKETGWAKLKRAFRANTSGLEFTAEEEDAEIDW